MFLTSLKQTCSEYPIKFSENQSAPKLENRKTSPCSPCAPNLPHVLLSRIPGYHNLCSPDWGQVSIGGKIIILWGDFELGARLLTYGGILLTFGGVIINYIYVGLFSVSCPVSSFLLIKRSFISPDAATALLLAGRSTNQRAGWLLKRAAR